jgi:hypothetical protein
MNQRRSAAQAGPDLCRGVRAPARAASLLLLSALPTLFTPVLAEGGQGQPPVKLAVFDFELEDTSASGAAAGPTPADTASMQAVSDKARALLAQSGRYSLVDTRNANADPARQHVLRNCNGCEAAIARQLGAEQALLGVVTRVGQIDYAVDLHITDARTGKLLRQERSVFLGADYAWSSGVSSLLRHRVLSEDYPP